MIFQGPGIQKGRGPLDLISQMDLMPTVLDFAGLSIPSSVQGVSIREAGGPIWRPGTELRFYGTPRTRPVRRICGPSGRGRPHALHSEFDAREKLQVSRRSDGRRFAVGKCNLSGNDRQTIRISGTLFGSPRYCINGQKNARRKHDIGPEKEVQSPYRSASRIKAKERIDGDNPTCRSAGCIVCEGCPNWRRGCIASPSARGSWLGLKKSRRQQRMWMLPLH